MLLRLRQEVQAMSRAGCVGEGLEEKKPSIEWAGAVLVNANGEFLLNLRDASKTMFPSMWDLIGGTLEDGETPEQCVLREILEETGEAVGAVDYMQAFDVPLGDSESGRLHVFSGRVDKPAAELLLGEGLEHRFFTASELAGIEIVPGIREMLEAHVANRTSDPRYPDPLLPLSSFAPPDSHSVSASSQKPEKGLAGKVSPVRRSGR